MRDMEILNKKSGGSQTVLRERNIALVINTIRENGPITKKDIVSITGLSFAKVNNTILYLTEKGLTHESGKEESIGGRPSTLFKLNANYRYVIGCQLSHSLIKTIICNLNGEVIASQEISYDKSMGKEVVVNLLLQEIERLISDSKIPIEKFLGVGIAVAGLINPKDETILPFPHLVQWGNISLTAIIKEKLKLPCYVKNVANAAALAEFNYGMGRGKSNLLFLNIGSGLGMGIIINGNLYEGFSGTAGEFGHITVDENGPLCECGNVGCLETVASIKAVVNRAKEMLQQGVFSSMMTKVDNDLTKLNFDVICEAANESDKLALSLIAKMGEALGEGIVTLINLFNPELIVLGGPVIQAKDLLIHPLLNIVRKRALEIPRVDTQIEFSEINGNVGTIGAVIPIVESFFSDALKTD